MYGAEGCVEERMNEFLFSKFPVVFASQLGSCSPDRKSCVTHKKGKFAEDIPVIVEKYRLETCIT